MILDKNKLEHQLYNPLLCQVRTHNRFIKLWVTERQSNKNLTFYNKVKGAFEAEPYLTLLSKTGSNLVARIRMSGHKLNEETGRMKSLFLPKHIVEFTKYVAELCRTRFPMKKKHGH